MSLQLWTTLSHSQIPRGMRWEENFKRRLGNGVQENWKGREIIVLKTQRD